MIILVFTIQIFQDKDVLMPREIEIFRFYERYWSTHRLLYSSLYLSLFPVCLDLAIDSWAGELGKEA